MITVLLLPSIIREAESLEPVSTTIGVVLGLTSLLGGAWFYKATTERCTERWIKHDIPGICILVQCAVVVSYMNIDA